MGDLAPFPVDKATLDLLSLALDPGDEAERTSVGDFLTLMSQMGGSDTDAVEYIETGPHPFVAGESVEWHHMRDAVYHEHDVIRALIAEVRRLRGDDHHPAPAETAPEPCRCAGHYLACDTSCPDSWLPDVPMSPDKGHAETAPEEGS